MSVHVCMCVCVRVCACVCVSMIKSLKCRHTKFQYVVSYDNSSDQFDIGLCAIKVNVMVGI